MTKTIVNVDGVDLFPYLRANAGEGFDPTDSDYREPQFGDVVGTGEPLLGITERNREVVVPVHVRAPATAMTNAILNPDFDDGTTTGWTIGASGVTTLTTGAAQTGWSSKGKYSCRFTASVGASGSANFVNASSPGSTANPASVGEIWTGIVDMNLLSNTSQVVVSINWFTGAGAFISVSSVTVSNLGEQRVLVRGTAPATTGFCSMTVQISSVIGAADLYFDSVALVKTSANFEPFSGTDLHAFWNGTANNSTSTTVAGRDGLTFAIENLHMALNNAKQLAWRDSGSTNITIFDVQFARFEPEYNYRRSQAASIQSGVIRIWTKPYGFAGTMRSLGTTQGTGAVQAINVGSFAGDLPAVVRTWVQRNHIEQGLNPGTIFGIAAVPSGYKYDLPAASIVRKHPSAVLVAPTSAASAVSGSQVIYFNDDNFLGSGEARIVEVGFSNASAYYGRNRVFAICAPAGDKLIRGYSLEGVPFNKRGALATGPGFSDTVMGLGITDLGVWNVPARTLASPGIPTVGFSLSIERVTTDNPMAWGGQVETSGFALNRLIVVPEDRTLVVNSYARRLLGYDMGSDSLSSGVYRTIDRLGNPWGVATPIATVAMGNKFYPQVATSGYGIHAGLVGHPTVADLTVESSFVLANAFVSAGTGAAGFVGKFVGGLDSLFAARVHLTAASGAVLNLISQSAGGPNYAVPTLIASKSIASHQLNSTLNTYHLTFQSKGPVLAAMLRTICGSVIATIAGSHANAIYGGQTVLGACGSLLQSQVGGMVISKIPSTAAEGVNLFMADGRNDYVMGVNTSVNAHVHDYREGISGAIPQVNPYDNIIAFESSVENAISTRTLWNMGAYIEERFSYAR